MTAMTAQERAFKVQMLAKLRATLADDKVRPHQLTTIYRETVARLSRELAQ